MKRILTITTIALGCVFCAFGQGSQRGQGFQGQNLREIENSVQTKDRLIANYLNGDEIKTVLSPGEYCEWTLNRKKGQVVFAEARSDAFDPALEILDEKRTVLAKNDDRYPGDQRPLLMWRCPGDGTYLLHLRCFHDRSGGQAFVRFKTYDSVDLPTDRKVQAQIDSSSPLLLRIPMKAGEIKEIISESGGDQNYVGLMGSGVISPVGLPDIDLSRPIQTVSNNSILVAPVDGDYYMLVWATERGREHRKIHVWTHEISTAKLTSDGAELIGRAQTRTTSIWLVSVKKGDLIEASAPDLAPYCQLLVAEAPDVAKYDLSKDDLNPFFPRLSTSREPAFDLLGGRRRDNRIAVLYARRDAKVWIATNGDGPANKEFSLRVHPAAATFQEDRVAEGTLRIGSTDYWQFEAKAGDVMTLRTRASSFSDVVVVRDPDMNRIQRTEAGVDQTTDEWKMIAQKPGRYLLALSCMGDGGGGPYSLERKVLPAKAFSVGEPASADITSGQVQIWKFIAKPDLPLLIHWNSSNWNYSVDIYDEKGQPTDFSREEVDGQNRFGILKVSKPQTYVVVLSGNGSKSHYKIDLAPIPGYEKSSSAKR